MITIGDYFSKHGQSAGVMFEEAVREADYALELNERVKFALLASFSENGNWHPGVVAVTTHRLLCCSSISHNTIHATLPFSKCIGIGDMHGLIRKEMPIHCDTLEIKVKATADNLIQLQEALLAAIEGAPVQKPIELQAGVTTRNAETYRKISKIRAAHKNERRLSKTEAAAYGKCPDCKGTVLIEVSGDVFCMHCGHNFQAKK